MQLNIKNPETVKLAHEVAQTFNETLVESVHKGLRLRLDQAAEARPNMTQAQRKAAMRQAAEAFAALPVLDDRDPDDMLYDEFGNPK